MVILKHSFPTMVADAITAIYIIVIEVSCIYQNQKGVRLVCFFNKF